MHAGQLAQLLAAIDRNTEAQIAHAKAVHRLADEAVNLVAMVAAQEQGEEPDPDTPQVTDLAGRPIN
jgi:hypothetical protein